MIPVTRAMSALVAILSWVMVARGMDYVTGNRYDMGRLWGDHLAMPNVWGTACLFVGFTAILGLVIRKPRLVVNVGLVGMAISVMFAIQVADMRMFEWPPEDIRIITDHLGQAASWLLVSATIHYRLGVEKRKAAILEEADG